MLALWLCIVKCLRYLFCYMFKLKICSVVQSLVLNYFVLLSLCVVPLLQRCVVVLTESHKNNKFDTTHLYSNLPKEFDNPELRCCFFVYECLVFACPLVVLYVKPLFAWTFNAPLCLCGLRLVCFV